MPPAAAWCRVKLGSLVTDNVLGGDASSLHGGALEACSASLVRGSHCRSSVGSGGAVLVADDVSSGPYWPVLACNGLEVESERH
jgi:hypothetical protein